MKQHSIPLEADQVQVTDPLFGSYVRLVGEKLIPYQWEALNDRIPGTEPSHCIDNFRVVAGQMQGGHRGAIFQDTDLYKWLEAVAFCIQNGTGRQYIPIADEVIELIGLAQCEDGYLNTYITIEHPENRWKNLAEGHELYGCGHLIEAAVAYYKATGKRNLLDIAKKFADLVVQVFGPGEGRCQGYPGHQEIELALVKLYRVTGKKAYLELADSFIRRRGARPNYLVEEMKGRHGHNIFPEFYEYDEKYAQTHEPPLQQSTAEGHAVRAVYMYSAMADLALEESDDEMRSACVRLYNNIVGRRMYITGGIGSSGKLERFTADYDLPNDRMYCESCASVGLMMFSQRMATLTGEADYYDTVERALCNTVLAGISKDGDRYFYVNPLEVWPDNCLPSTSMSHVKPVRQPWFACACCPPNIARTLASLAQYLYAADEDSLYVNQLIRSTANVEIGGAAVHADLQADYLHSGLIRLAVQSERPVTVRLRLPDYLKVDGITVDGKPVTPAVEHGYTVFALPGDAVIEVKASAPARFVAAHRRVRASTGRVALMKGPFVYCLEQTDNGEALPALSVSHDAVIQKLPPLSDLPGELPVLEVEGRRLTQTTGNDDALYDAPHFASEPTRLRAVPYALWCNRTPGEMQVWINAAR